MLKQATAKLVEGLSVFQLIVAEFLPIFDTWTLEMTGGTGTGLGVGVGLKVGKGVGVTVGLKVGTGVGVGVAEERVLKR